LLLLSSYGNYLQACTFGNVENEYDNEKDIKRIHYIYLTFLVLTYLTGTIFSNILLLFLIFTLFPPFLFLSFIKRYKLIITLKKAIYVFYQNNTLSIPSALLSIVYYFLVILLILPTDKSLANLLLVLYLFPKTISIIFLFKLSLLRFDRKHILSKKVLINNSIRFFYQS
jgi:hypothetical protein